MLYWGKKNRGLYCYKIQQRTLVGKPLEFWQCSTILSPATTGPFDGKWCWKNFAIQFSHVKTCDATETSGFIQHTRWLNPESRKYKIARKHNYINIY
jgi:hypothetical protein